MNCECFCICLLLFLCFANCAFVVVACEFRVGREIVGVNACEFGVW